MAGALALAVGGGFTLGWTHSVERVEWQESWRVEGRTLHLVEARVRGSGAGMEAGEGAVRRDGWWVWNPDRRILELRLAASGETQGGWRLCTDAGCRELGARSDEGVVLRSCPSRMLGLLGDALSERMTSVVISEIPKDITRLPEREIREVLEHRE